jgi:hypothetical protein
MTNQHRATPEQWVRLDKWSTEDIFLRTVGAFSCLLEVRARIEALEAAQQPPQDKLDRLIALDAEEVARIVAPSFPAGSLVERVADAIAAQATSAGIVNDRPARAAILEVAAWMRAESEGHLGSGLHYARRLEQEANQ